MGKSRRSGWRAGIGALAMFAIASGLLVGTATVAEAKQISSVDQLEKSCAKGTGTFSRSGTTGVCLVKDGIVTCTDKTVKGVPKCAGKRYRTLVPTDTVRTPNGVELTTQTVPDSQVWRQKLSIPTLTDSVCPSLDGEFVASPDATIGVCAAPTARIICTDVPGTNCLGIAGTEKRADSIPRQIKKVIANSGSTTTSPTTPPTTSSNAPPTTKTCPIGGCPPPTLPPAKAPGQSVPIVPPQNR